MISNIVTKETCSHIKFCINLYILNYFNNPKLLIAKTPFWSLHFGVTVNLVLTF